MQTNITFEYGTNSVELEASKNSLTLKAVDIYSEYSFLFPAMITEDMREREVEE